MRCGGHPYKGDSIRVESLFWQQRTELSGWIMLIFSGGGSEIAPGGDKTAHATTPTPLHLNIPVRGGPTHVRGTRMPQPHISVFKYPLGFIRLIEFLFIVLAIAAVNSWSFSMSYECPPPNGTTPTPPPPPPKTVKATTFTLSKVDVSTCNDTNIKLWSGDNDAGGAAGFFYFVNVAALIFVLIITFVYVVFWDLYQENKRIVLGDLAVTALFFILFFFCSSIWWAGSNTIGYSTGEEEIKKLMDGPIYPKGTEPLGLNRSTNNGKLAISVLCDWMCAILFAFNCWFVWKEIVPRDQEHPGVIG